MVKAEQTINRKHKNRQQLRNTKKKMINKNKRIAGKCITTLDQVKGVVQDAAKLRKHAKKGEKKAVKREKNEAVKRFRQEEKETCANMIDQE